MSDERHRRPASADDATVEAVGKVSEALEWVERARGRLYDFHQMMGHADALFGEAADALADAGATEQADDLRRHLVGRNAIDGRWTFQIVEEYDDGYWSLFRELEHEAREQIADGQRHLLEAEMKSDERTQGLPGHEASPAEDA